MEDELNNRRAVIRAAGALAAMMLQPGWVAAAKAQTESLRADPRYAFVDRVSELTIPATDTPGASAAGVPAFVLLALDQHMNGLDPAMLDRLQTRLNQDAGASFIGLAEPGQVRVLSALDAVAFSGPDQPASPEHAWRRIKSAIVAGYYSSEIGASEELVYQPVPGRFQNISLTPEFRLRSNDGFGGGW